MMMMKSNRIVTDASAKARLFTCSDNVNTVIENLEEALLSYEMILSDATGAGIDAYSFTDFNYQFNYQWTYVSSVFFTSTVITTVGECCNILYTSPLLQPKMWFVSKIWKYPL